MAVALWMVRRRGKVIGAKYFEQVVRNFSTEFFSLSPGDRWNKMEKGRICYSCMAPKDVCVNRRCSFEAKVPESLKCQGCAVWAQPKNLAPLSVFFCRKKEHATLRAPFKEMRRDLEQYHQRPHQPLKQYQGYQLLIPHYQ